MFPQKKLSLVFVLSILLFACDSPTTLSGADSNTPNKVAVTSNENIDGLFQENAPSDTDLEQQLKQFNKQIAELENNLDVSQQNSSSLREQLESSEIKQTELSEKVLQLQTEKQDLQEQMSQQMAEIEILEAALQKLETDCKANTEDKF